MKKFVVPEGARPPEEEEIKSLLSRMMSCQDCGCILDQFAKYYSSKLD